MDDKIPLGKFVKSHRKLLGLTQEEFASKAGVGLRFLRDLEQGKTALRMNKVLQVLDMFDAELVPMVRGEAKTIEQQSEEA